MRKLLTAGLACVVLASSGCEDPSAPVPASFLIPGAYDAAWTIHVSNVETGESETLVCPGSVSLTSGSAESTFRGTYQIRSEGGCAAGSPISGDVDDGTVRRDGGLNFVLKVPEEGGTVFEDLVLVLGNSSVIQGACLITDADEFLTGTIEGEELRAAADAILSCDTGGEEPVPAIMQLRVSAIQQ